MRFIRAVIILAFLNVIVERTMQILNTFQTNKKDESSLIQLVLGERERII